MPGVYTTDYVETYWKVVKLLKHENRSTSQGVVWSYNIDKNICLQEYFDVMSPKMRNDVLERSLKAQGLLMKCCESAFSFQIENPSTDKILRIYVLKDEQYLLRLERIY